VAKNDPYTTKKVTSNAYADKVPLEGVVVAVLRGTVADRGLELIPQPSRAVSKGEVHELILTPEAVSPGDRVGAIAYLAFVEFQSGGVLLAGDKLFVDGEEIAELVGFDMSHFPNHMNIVARGDLRSGEERGISLNSKVTFLMRS
jgi:hypothetical protein